MRGPAAAAEALRSGAGARCRLEVVATRECGA